MVRIPFPPSQGCCEYTRFGFCAYMPLGAMRVSPSGRAPSLIPSGRRVRLLLRACYYVLEPALFVLVRLLRSHSLVVNISLDHYILYGTLFPHIQAAWLGGHRMANAEEGPVWAPRRFHVER